MARGTFSTSNYFDAGINSFGALVNGATSITMTGRVRLTTAPSAATAWVFNALTSSGATSLFGIRIADSGSGAKAIAGGRSVLADGNQGATGATTVSTGVWFSVVGVLRFTAKTSQVWLNGASDGTGSSHTWANSSLTNATGSAYADSVGCFLGGTGVAQQVLDGSLADLGLWSVELSADEIAAYAKGQPAWRIRPQSNVWCSDLVRELRSRRGPTLTQVGTVPVVDHPRIFGAP